MLQFCFSTFIIIPFDCKHAKRINVQKWLLKKQPFKFYLSLKIHYFCIAKKNNTHIHQLRNDFRSVNYTTYTLHLCLLKKEKRHVPRKGSKT